MLCITVKGKNEEISSGYEMGKFILKMSKNQHSVVVSEVQRYVNKVTVADGCNSPLGSHVVLFFDNCTH